MDQKGPGEEPAVEPAETPKSTMGDDARRLAQGRFDAMRTYGTVGTVGLSFVFAIALGTALGLWLDRVTGLSPLFFIVFFLCGIAAGVLNVYRTFSRLK